MSTPIGKYPQSERLIVIKRRIASQTLGLGFWSAIKYAKRLGMKLDSKIVRVVPENWNLRRTYVRPITE